MKNMVHVIENLAYRLRNQGTRFKFLYKNVILVVLKIVKLLSFLAAVAVVTSITIYVGFDHTSTERTELQLIVGISQWIFISTVILRLLIDRQSWLHKTRLFKRLVDIAILISLLPLIAPGNPLFSIFNSHWYIWVVLLLYSILDISQGLMYLIGQRVNPAVMLGGSFLILIFTGTFLLMLPKCTYGGIDFIDSLFISTSAVCITGLTPVDISAIFTPLGLFILALLIQIGGLGLLTFTSVFALSFTGNTSIYSQLMMKDMVYSRSWSSLPSTLLYILWFTLTIESVGAIAVFSFIHGKLGMTLGQEIFTSIFTSLSGFCNAGFCNIPGGLSNGALLWSGSGIYWTMTLLIIAGSIGFPLLVNLKDIAFIKFNHLCPHLCRNKISRFSVHLLDMNSKVVIFTYGILFIAGAILFGFFEWGNTLSGMSMSDKIAQASFNSAVPRSAGFSSVSVSDMLDVTVLLIIFLMWIGGSSQSTGGGIKVNTFAAIMLNLKAIIRGGGPTKAYGRRIAVGSVRRANAVVALSIIGYFLYSTILLAFEPSLPAKDLLFESASALFTVGSSMGITPQLSDKSLLLLCSAMFIGRAGVLSLLTGFASRHPDANISLPTGDLIIN